MHERQEWILRPGTQIGKYRVEAVLGEGAFGVVYRAVDTRLGRQAALKVLRPERLPDPELRRAFLQEARLVARLNHPHIVRVWDVLQAGETYAVAMEYLPEGNLRQWVQRTQPSLDQMLRLLRQVARALDYVHQQTYPDSHRPLLHRDVKPENVLIDRVPGSSLVIAKLSDFGISLPLDWLRQQGLPGTVHYLAPELIRQDRGWPVDGRADQYALAVMAYELLCGRRPFEGRDPIAIMRMHLNEPPPRPSRVCPHLLSPFDEPLLKALSKHPRDRYPSCSAFVRALEVAWENSLRERLQRVYEALRENGSGLEEARRLWQEVQGWAPEHPLVLQTQQYIQLAELWHAARQNARRAWELWPAYPDTEDIFPLLLGLRWPRWLFSWRRMWKQALIGGLLALPWVLGMLVFALRWALSRPSGP